MNRKHGATFLPWLFILLMLGSLLWLLNRLNVQLQHQQGCEDQLLRIYEILNVVEQQNGRLPALELFPDDPLENEKSILKALGKFEFDPAWAVCPASHPVLKQNGVTYLWNTALNHTSLKNRKEKTWVLVDIQALDDKISGPHFGSYHILYTDGQVEHSSSPPHSLPVQFE